MQSLETNYELWGFTETLNADVRDVCTRCAADSRLERILIRPAKLQGNNKARCVRQDDNGVDDGERVEGGLAEICGDNY